MKNPPSVLCSTENQMSDMMVWKSLLFSMVGQQKTRVSRPGTLFCLSMSHTFTR
jgi:hypothetical protein